MAVAEQLEALGIDSINFMGGDARCDGGDVIVGDDFLFVGLTTRTNEAGFRAVRDVFGRSMDVIPIDLREIFSAHSGNILHLKSLASLYDSRTAVIADCPEGRALCSVMEETFTEICSWFPKWRAPTSSV